MAASVVFPHSIWLSSIIWTNGMTASVVFPHSTWLSSIIWTNRMTASVVFPHSTWLSSIIALLGTSRNHMLWFNESTHLILKSYKNRQVCTRMSGQVYVKILATPKTTKFGLQLPTIMIWHSLMPRLRTPPGEKRSGEQSRISWAYALLTNVSTNC